MTPLNLDHIGIAVFDLESSIAKYTNDLGFKIELRENLPDQKITLAFLKMESSSIELIAPTGPGSTISKFLDRRGEGLHHICYKVDDIKSELQRLQDLHYQLIDKNPRPGARNTMIAFIHPKQFNGVLTELCQYKA